MFYITTLVHFLPEPISTCHWALQVESTPPAATGGSLMMYSSKNYAVRYNADTEQHVAAPIVPLDTSLSTH